MEVFCLSPFVLSTGCRPKKGKRIKADEGILFAPNAGVMVWKILRQGEDTADLDFLYSIIGLKGPAFFPISLVRGAL